MKLRFKAFGLHLLGSATVLTLTLGTLYLGWYRWPGWYLADVPHVLTVLLGVDIVLGPTLTLIVASPKKPRRVLARDIAVIVAFQLSALLYGAAALWNGRPLYYALFRELPADSSGELTSTPASWQLAREQHSQFTPHWYSLPRWVWAPLPDDPKVRKDIVSSAIQGGFDVIEMPRYFKPWEQGLPALRTQLKSVDDIRYFHDDRKEEAQTAHAGGRIRHGPAQWDAADRTRPPAARRHRSCQLEDRSDLKGNVARLRGKAIAARSRPRARAPGRWAETDRCVSWAAF